MGWKAVRDHYQITHTVQRRDGDIWVGSGYLPSALVIGPAGEIKKRYTGPDEDLSRYQHEMDQDLAKLQQLVTMQDEFGEGLVVYTFDGGSIIEKRCDARGWPNVTHDGEVMYENSHFLTRAEAVERALANAVAARRSLEDRIAGLREELQTAASELAKWQAAAAALSEQSDGGEPGLVAASQANE